MEAGRWMDLAKILTIHCDTIYMYIHVAVHVHYDVVTDWSYALAGFLVSMLFGVSPGQS